MSDKDKEKGFKVTDRRGVEEEREKTPQSAAFIPPEAGPSDQHSHEKTQAHHGPIDFRQFILSLATSALIQMGEAPHPQSGESFEDMAAARQTIDIIEMLQEKTKGNLDKDESGLIQGVLAELRIRYVNRAKRGK